MRNFVVFTAVWLLCLPAATARATECHVDTTRQRVVRFISDAPLDDFDGVTDRIDGYVYLVADGLHEGEDYPNSEFYFEVDLASLDTGIGLRNRHMRENYLETDTYPFAKYSGTLAKITRQSDTAYVVALTGRLEIHGVQRPLETDVIVAADGDRYHVQAAFEVALPDFKIKVPKLMFLKINEIVKLQLDFYLRTVHNKPEEGP